MTFTSWLRGWKRQLPLRTGPARKRHPRSVRPACEELETRLTPSVSFLGVGAGDATSSDAILWTRAQDSSTPGVGVALTALVSKDTTFATGAFYTGTTDPTQDYTIHLDATGLQAGTRYYYRFTAATPPSARSARS
jgi:phosphodiesterase/alkaline phosphatase D-like protein